MRNLYRLRQPNDPDNSMTVEWYYPDDEEVFEEFNPNIKAAYRVADNILAIRGRAWLALHDVAAIVAAALTLPGEPDER